MRYFIIYYTVKINGVLDFNFVGAKQDTYPNNNEFLKEISKIHQQSTRTVITSIQELNEEDYNELSR